MSLKNRATYDQYIHIHFFMPNPIINIFFPIKEMFLHSVKPLLSDRFVYIGKSQKNILYVRDAC